LSGIIGLLGFRNSGPLLASQLEEFFGFLSQSGEGVGYRFQMLRRHYLASNLEAFCSFRSKLESSYFVRRFLPSPYRVHHRVSLFHGRLNLLPERLVLLELFPLSPSA